MEREEQSADLYIAKSLRMLRKLPPLGGRILISSVLLIVASLRDTGCKQTSALHVGHWVRYSCKHQHSKDRSRGDSSSRCMTHQGNSRKHFTVNSVPEVMPTDVHSLELIKPHKMVSVLKGFPGPKQQETIHVLWLREKKKKAQWLTRQLD